MKRNKQLIIGIKQHIEKNFKDPSFNVTKLCLFVCISRSSLNRKFKKLYHCDPREYIEDIRLQYAKMKLEEDDDSIIKEIAFEAGFANAKYFSIKFKQKYLITPSELKKQNQEKMLVEIS
jgi:AraC-like DNA-binding protein